MSTTTIFSGLTAKQCEAFIQSATLDMLGIDPATDDQAYAKVRISWQTQGQPVSSPDEDVIYVRAVEFDDPYNRVRDLKFATNDATTVLSTTMYTRCWEVFWVIYGPNSFDVARQIRSKLFTQDIHDEFAGVSLYLVTDVAAPVRIPEQNDTGEWFERVDFTARFYEGVTEQEVDNSIGSTEVIIQKQE